MVASVVVCLLSLKRLFDRRSAFYRELDRYLHTYDDIIVNTTTSLDLSAYKTLTVENFKELLNLSHKTNSPILYWKGHNEAHFYIPQSELLFLFRITEE